MSASRNLGFRQSNGSLIALIDADDVWLPEKLSEQIQIMRDHPEVGLVYGLAEYWRDWKPEDNSAGSNNIPTVPKLDYIANPPELALSAYPLGTEPAPCPSCMLFTKELIESVGGFEESFRGMFEDQAFLAKVYLNESIYVASNVWIKYRIHADSCCSVAQAAGQVHWYKNFFLRWLGRYMLTHRFFNKKVWKAWWVAFKPYIFAKTPKP